MHPLAPALGLALAALPATAGAASVKVLFNFGGGSSSSYAPLGNVVVAGGTIYGLNSYGGKNSQGAFWSFVPSTGKLTELYSFAGAPSDARGIEPGLIYTHGKFYGSSYRGGANDCGAVFSLTPAGGETLVHAMDCNTEGEYTQPLAELGGTLYGENEGGPNNITLAGDTFSLSRGGAFALTYIFGKDHIFQHDGAAPWAGLTPLNGTLYGVTQNGLTYNSGILFSLTPGGTKTTLAVFGSPQGGTTPAIPTSPITYFAGKFWGFTQAGGAAGYGALYSYDLAGGALTLVKSFGPGHPSGADLSSKMTVFNGKLYGAVSGGGAYGSGFIFSIDRRGNFVDVYDLNGNIGEPALAFGAFVPYAGGLIGVSGNGGGGGGTLYTFTP